jgi:hypothetical protein
MSDNKMYCGPRAVPKGKVRASLEYCIRNGQVRYYGIVAIDPKLLDSIKGQASSLLKEQFKLKKLEDKAHVLIKDVKKLKIILENTEASKSKLKRAQQRMNNLLKQRDKLVKHIASQKKIVKNMEENEEV